MPNKFGGQWTAIKPNVLQPYLNAYLKVMKNQPFSLAYIAASAGSGQMQIAKGRLIDDSKRHQGFQLLRVR